ncbi:unnamed protein product [Caenorhabditis angaria]|uniref:SXP/RAL-2 family protein Ani s 5-like cation-binding domain-containing protein n=1 Tax=Caenorhabditis angaria TaxID=860376 RepID=A0A9P1J080_9PELO|nr:unnamed protein product [Caenorhabditis angaria]
MFRYITPICVLLAIAVVLEASPRFRHRPPCGLPPFADDLPTEQQNNLTEIWKDYKEGDSCDEEQTRTREVIDSLPKELRKNLHRRPTPPYLKGVSKDILEKFQAIWKDKSIAWPDKHEKIEELAEKTLTGDNLKQFKEFKAKKAEQTKEYEAKEAKLSTEAKEAHEKIEALQKQKFQIISDLSEKAKEELFDLWHSRPFGRFGGGRGGHH